MSDEPTIGEQYLASMLAAYDERVIGRDREAGMRKWLAAAKKAEEQGWTPIPDDKTE